MDLREACLQEALAIIETTGIESLSLREVARRLGVSHQAPYKHFPSRDHILAEIVSRAFTAFAHYLDERAGSADPHTDLESMGRAYLSYAQAHPLQYRLMFGTPLPDPAQHPAMMQNAQHAFALLRDCIGRLQPATRPPHEIERDALFVWATMHGIASILQTHALETLALSDDVLKTMTDHSLLRIGTGLGVAASAPGGDEGYP